MPGMTSILQSIDLSVNKVFKDDDISSMHLDNHINLFKLNGDVSNPAGMVG